ncbi:hypothetical protein [Hoylesella timonensis]|uniref:hypothetical protein n=1 Tax=Hoylesella timonensis TaxID=386414 RepID=UPI00288B43A2|nr:hypothetical protein [Hoylesella timonensis]
MENEVTKWNKIIYSIMNLPGIKVDRVAFLVEALRPHCTETEIKKAALQRPIDVIPLKLINQLATECINDHTKKATIFSTITGVPGGIAVFFAIPADLLQYFCQTLIIAQKLAYLYGYPDLCDQNGHLTESSYDVLTIFLGVMLGSSTANEAFKQLSETFAEHTTMRMPQVGVSETMWYPLVKGVSKWVRTKFVKGSVTKRLSKAVPVIGGVVAGFLTYKTFKPNAKRLKKQMQANAMLFKSV